ncbi:MAG: tetratricopeptide repeat protein [Dehalococcoidia bacterium]|nr:tetratricopeptide repeat protein [Dehalococcoidia bacterium]
MSSVSREASRTSDVNPSIFVERGIEGLWLLTAALVPLIFVPTNFMMSEAINAYVEVPKTTAFRFLVGLMTILWIAESVLKGGINRRYSIANYPGRIASWLSEQPGRWVVVAAIFYVAVAIITTLLSQSLWISLWGEVSGQFGYSLYTTFSYFILFLIITTHLKTRTQLWRLLGVIVVTGALVSLYGILQHYDLDPLNLGEGGFTRVSATMANPIFAGAVLVTTGLLTLGIAVTALNRRGWSPLGVAMWVAIIGAQFITVYWTGSRGSWLIGMPVGLVAFLFLLGLAEGSAILAKRLTIFLGLLGILVLLGIMVLLGQLLMLGQIGIPGTPVFVVLLTLVGLLGTLTGSLILSDFLATRTGPDRWRTLRVISTSLPAQDLTFLRVFPRAFIVLMLAIVIAYLVIWLTPDPSGSSAGDRLSSVTSETSERGAGFRTNIWSSSLGLIWNRPWFEYEDLSISYLRPLVGYGPDLFKYVFPLENTRGGLLSQAHNFILHHWVEQGVLGLFSSLSIFVAFFLAGFIQLWRNRETYSITHKLILVTLLATVAGRTAEMMVGVAREPDLVLFWIILAVFVALPSIMNPSAQTSRVASGPDDGAAIRQERRRERRRARRSGRGRRNIATISPFRVTGVALVSALVVFIGWLSWDKNVDYAWAAQIAASADRDYNDGKLQEAEVQILKAISKAPDIPVYYNLLAGVYNSHRYTAVNNPDRELQSCEVAFRLEPRDDHPLQSAGPYDRCAWEAYESNLKGFRKNQDSAQAKLLLANSALNLALLGYDGKEEEAVRYFEELTNMLPSSWPTRNNLATAYIRLGRELDALAYLDDALSIVQSPDHYAQVYYLRGLAQRRLDRTQEAIASFERSLAENSGAGSDTAVSTYRQLADLYADLGDDAKSEEHRKLYEELSRQ